MKKIDLKLIIEIRNGNRIMKQLKAISLFSGAGGDTLGLTEAGIDVVAFSENNKDAIETHLKRFPTSELLNENGLMGAESPRQKYGETNISKISDDVFKKYHKKIDLIFAGFPCQGFSNAGKKKIDDCRNELVYEFVRVVDIIKPKWIVGENVTGLLSRKGRDPKSNELRPIIDIIKDLFAEIGYTINWSVQETQYYGVPQLRKRLIIVGRQIPSHTVSRDETTSLSAGISQLELHSSVKNISLPPPDKTRTCPTIRSILKPILKDAILLENIDIIKQAPPSIWIETNESNVYGKVHNNLIRLLTSQDVLEKAKRNGHSNLLSIGKRVSPIHGEILNPDSCCKTIICNYHLCPRLFVGLYNPNTKKYYVRTLQIDELAQIQGFPSSYPFVGTEKSIIIQIGNAVPPPLVKHIGEFIVSVDKRLTKTSRSHS